MSRRFGLLAAVSLFAATAANAVPHYHYTDLGVLPGDMSSTARAISDNGLIAGESGFGAANNRVARFDAGPTPLVTLPDAFTVSTRGINVFGVAATVVQGDVNADVPADDRAALSTVSGVTQLFAATGFAAAGAFDITNSGIAVGYSLSSGANFGVEGGLPVVPGIGGNQRATVWNNSTAGVLLADPCAPAAACNSNAVSIGEDGQIAGIVRGSLASSVRGVRWDAAGPPTLLTAPGITSSRTREINDHGWVAGQVFGAAYGSGTGAVWASDAANPFILQVSGFTETVTRGIDNFGNVVGFGYADEAALENGDATGLLWLWNGAGYDSYLLDSLVDLTGLAHTYAVQGLNDAGQIIGFGPNPAGDIHAYLLSVVPEPASWGLLIAGFAVTGAALRRRRAVAA